MPMLLGFEYFGPYTGEMPENTAIHEHGIFKRSVAFLKTRSEAECAEIISVVNLVYESLPITELQLKVLELEAQRFDAELESDDDSSFNPDSPRSDDESDWLFWATERVSLSDFSAIPNLAWHELFSALAIGLLNIAAEEELLITKGRSDIDALDEKRVLFKLCYWLQCAERAVSYAQALLWGKQQYESSAQRPDDVVQAATKLVSDRARIAALQRHAPTNKAILALTRYFHEGSFSSISEAVRQFCQHAPEAVRHLAPTNRQRTLREGLSKQLSGRRTPA